jgi:hypothetical protein
MSFSVEGDYFETCTCDVSCPCIWVKPADKETCDVMLAWHVTKGDKDGVDLSGLNAVLAVHSPKQMTDGGWKLALYLDDRATAEQSEAMGAVFSGGAGGHLAALGRSSARSQASHPPRSRSTGPADRCVPSRWCPHHVGGGDRGDGRRICSGHHQPAVRSDRQPVTQAKAGDVSFHGAWDVEYSGTNSFVTDFKYEG